MKKEERTIVYDERLGLEAYNLEGIVAPFPNHFHDYYVIGLMELGQRNLKCKHKNYLLNKGDVVIFNPGDNHQCAPVNDSALYYRGINIPKKTMMSLVKEITGVEEMPGFSKNVVVSGEIACYLKPLHQMIMSGYLEFDKEENLLFLISVLLQNYGRPFESCIMECKSEIEAACEFMDNNFSKHIYLEEICTLVGLSKSTLLRAFTKSKGITPYRYLETVRISKAKKLLEGGTLPIDAAMETGFCDQSHFTNYFTSVMGVSPGAYRDIFNNKKSENGDNYGKANY